MTTRESRDEPVEATPEGRVAVDAERLSPTEAFSLLGNDTRIAILETLWEHPESTVSFSQLYEGVGVDKGNFNYHLSQLSGQFVRRTDEGYELREAGHQVMRAVLAGVLTEDPELGPVETDRPCPFCGSTIEIYYRDEALTIRCQQCAGTSGGDLPHGAFARIDFPPAGLEGRTLVEVTEAAHLHFEATVAMMMQGVCAECCGRTETELHVCHGHVIGSDGLCETCGSVPEVMATFTCQNCQFASRTILWMPAIYHPAAIASLYERFEFDTFLELQRVIWSNPEFVTEITETIVSTDPLLVRVEFPTETGRLGLTFDEALCITDVSWTDAE